MTGCIQPTRNYRKTSSLSRAKSESLTVSGIVLQLALVNPLKPGVKLRMKNWVISNFIAYYLY